MSHIFNFTNLERFYKSSRSIKHLKFLQNMFPFRASSELAGIVADLMADGHLQGVPKWRFDYCSNSTEELLRFENCLYKLFKIKGKIRKCTTNNYGTMNYGVNSKNIAIFLFLIGVPAGEKVSQSYSIPDWVLYEKDFFKRFVQRYFDCECYVDTCTKTIEVQFWKTEAVLNSGFDFLNSIKFYLLHYFNIKTCNPFLQSSINVRKDSSISRGIRLKIRHKKSLKNFKRFIGLETPRKRKKLAIIAN